MQSPKKPRKIKPWSYRVRENKKSAGLGKALQAPHSSSRIAGAVQVLKSYYFRSLEAAIRAGYDDIHPSFQKYAGMLLRQMKQEGHQFPADVMKALCRRYPPRKGLAPGSSYWEPGDGLGK